MRRPAPKTALCGNAELGKVSLCGFDTAARALDPVGIVNKPEIDFANALAVTVKDASNNPVSGVSVAFTAPGSGASGKFSNIGTSISVSTNAAGVASAPFTANATPGGPYTVTAATAGLPIRARSRLCSASKLQFPTTRH